MAYLPFGSATNVASSKVNITEDDSGILASNVDGIRFTYTVPASDGPQPSPTIREIDVFGSPTVIPLELRISQTGGMLDFEWNSQSGRQYDLLSSTDLSTSPGAWAP